MKLDSLERKLQARLNRIFRYKGYDSNEVEDLDLYKIEFKEDTKNKRTDITIYAELSVEEFMDNVSLFDAVVTKVDPAAFFDVIEPGVYQTAIYWDAAKKSKSPDFNVMSKKNLTKLGETICLELSEEYKDDFWVEEISYNRSKQRLSVEVVGHEYESDAYVKLYEYDLDSYVDLTDVYLDKIIKELKNHITEV